MLNKQIINFSLIALLAVATLLNVARADGDQFYFVGMAAPLGSISKEGSSANGIYLRWDVIEGRLPSDVDEFILYRDGDTDADILASFSAAQIQGVSAINALYAKPENIRRKAEMIRWLDAAKNDTDGDIDASNFASAIVNKLNPANEDGAFWASFASRSDFNVAVIRHRGYVDSTATGIHTYKLYAKNTGSGAKRLLGSLQVDVSVLNVLPAAGDFTQATRATAGSPNGLGRCDLVSERYKDHGTVALNWEPAAAGSNATDRYVSVLLTAGFDLYRADKKLIEHGDVPVKDIRSLAQTSAQDGRGYAQIPGLQKVNDLPIQVAANELPDSGNPFFQPAFYQFLETRSELITQGMNPGDHRAYYLVARDITGNYGQTSSLEVIVPDLNAPPAPWRIDTVIDPVDNTFKLTWDHVDVLNYQRSHEFSRSYCNLESARFDKELRFVTAGEECRPGREISVNLDVEKYIIYRFPDSETAGAFTDVDGDGYSDYEERLYDHDNNSGTPAVYHKQVVGTACDVNTPSVNAGAKDYRAGEVLASSLNVLPSGRKVLSLDDAVPVAGDGVAAGAGNVFWYRIASRDANGNVSSLSKPVRALFPVDKRPLRSELSDAVFGSQSCSYQFVPKASTSGAPFATDSSGDAASVSFECGGKQFTSELDVDLPEQVCREIEDVCADNQGMELTYLSANGAPLASSFIKWKSCPLQVSTELVEVCDPLIVEPAFPGDVVELPLLLDFIVPVGTCLNIYRDIAGEPEHFQTICESGSTPIDIDVATMGDQLCLSIALQSVDNEVSSLRRLSCVTVEDDSIAVPMPPRVLGVSFASASGLANIQLLPPEQPLAGSIVEWYWKNAGETFDQTRYDQYFPHAQQTTNDGPIDIALDINTEQGGSAWQEEWCVRARSVAKIHSESARKALSSWSAWRCETRRPGGVNAPSNLPWPHVESPPSLGFMQSRYLTDDQEVALLLSDDALTFPNSQCFVSGVLSCDFPSTGGRCLPVAGSKNIQNAACEEFCPTVISGISGGLDFVVYRQRASNTSDPSTFTDYVQVSPLIENVYCQTEYAQGGTGTAATLSDSYIMLTDFTSGSTLWTGNRAVYRDRYPLIQNQYYRYQIVYFERGEITGHRETSWVRID